MTSLGTRLAQGSTAAPASVARATGRRRDGVPGACDRLLDVSVVVLATWTVVYHVCLVLRLGVQWAVALEAVALAGLGLLAWRAGRRRRADAGGPPDLTVAAVAADAAAAEQGVGTRPDDVLGPPGVVRGVLLTTAALAAVVAALLMAVQAAWPLVAGMWLTAAVAGTLLAVVEHRAAVTAGAAGLGPAVGRAAASARGGVSTQAVGARRGLPRVLRAVVSGSGPGSAVALAWASGLGVLALLARWSNPDDLYYVNLAQWVVDHGSFPVRDTLFSDLVYPMASWPPVASYDALAGTLAWLIGVPAATVVYVVVPPLATFLSVLALWRLLRTWQVRAVALALSVALAFLLLDGGTGYAAPGNLFLIRIWQGKVILLCLLVPLLLVYALRFVERPTWRRAGWLFAGGVAAVGLSTTAMFLVPLLAVGGVAPLVLTRPVRALVGLGAAAAYPLGAGVVTLALGGRSADVFESRKLFRFDPAWFGHEIFRDGPIAAVAVAAVLAGALLLPLRAARVTTGVLVGITGVTFVPGVTVLAYDLIGLGPTLWRVSWLVTVAALVGVLAAALVGRRGRTVRRLAAPFVLVVVLVASGLPIWSRANGVYLDVSPGWKRDPSSLAAAEGVLATSEPGDLVLAPDNLAITVTVSTTAVKTVAPRAYFMAHLRDEPAFHYPERLTLLAFANREVGMRDPVRVTAALDLLDVDQVCLAREATARSAFLRSIGYQPSGGSSTYVCFQR